MDTIIEVCAGLDVHKETVTGNVRYRDERGRRRATARQAGTTTAELLELSDWLGELGVGSRIRPELWARYITLPN